MSELEAMEVQCSCCQKPITLHGIDPEGMREFNLGRFLKANIWCMKCASHRMRMRSLTLAIHKAAVNLIVYSRSRTDAAEEIRNSSGKELEKLLPAYVSELCRHWKRENLWDDEILDRISEDPRSYMIVLKTVKTMILESPAQAEMF